MNVGKMLVELGFKPKPKKEGLSAPPTISPTIQYAYCRDAEAYYRILKKGDAE
jgi:hypothetical protein